MDEDMPQQEPEKPRFQLPDGCKELIDELRLQQQTAEAESSQGSSSSSPDSPQPLPTSVALPDPVAVRDLASALHLKPFEVIGLLMQFNVFSSLNTQLDFDTASALCTHYGVAATKVV
jgi:hypothetical protein